MELEKKIQEAAGPFPGAPAVTPRVALAVLGHLLVHGMPPSGEHSIAAPGRAAVPSQRFSGGKAGGYLGLLPRTPGAQTNGGGNGAFPFPSNPFQASNPAGGPPVGARWGMASVNGGEYRAPAPRQSPVRLAPPNGVDHPARVELLRLAREQPGQNIHEIARHLGLSRGATRYHLRALIRHGHVVTHRQGHHLLHFAAAMPPLQRRAVALLRIGSLRAIVGALVQDRAIRPSALAGQLGLSARSVRRGINTLANVGLALQHRDARGRGQDVELHPDARIAWVLWCKGAGPAEPAPEARRSPAWVFPLETILVSLVSRLLV